MFPTSAKTVSAAVSQAGVKLDPTDLVEPGLNTPITDSFFNINVYRSMPALVVDGDHVTTVETGYRGPRQIATSAKLNLYPEDQVSNGLVTDFIHDHTVGQKVVITRATPLTIKTDGKLMPVRTLKSTVAEVLAEKGIKLGPEDTVTPALSAPIPVGGQIVITRVTQAVVQATETIPRPTTTVTDPNQPRGFSAVQNPGADGSRHVTYRVHYQDGVEVGRETLSIDSIVQPKAKVVSVGTKVFFSGSVEYWRPMVDEAAASTGVDPNLMLSIMRCESNGNANSSNGTHFGLYQYSQSTWESYGMAFSDIFDGAKQIWATAGRLKISTTPWAASQSCWSKYQ